MAVPADWSIVITRNGPFDIKSLSDPRAICPHCKNASTFNIRAQVHRWEQPRTYLHLILECNFTRCHGMVYVMASLKDGSTVLGPEDKFFMYPSGSIDPAHPGVPPQIAEDWMEAQIAMQAGAPKAAAVMFRRVLYGVLLDKGCTLQPLRKGLSELIQRNRLPAIFDDWLPAIRDDGHDAAHPDRALQVDPENISETLEYTFELLRFLYIEPYEFRERKARIATSPAAPPSVQ